MSLGKVTTFSYDGETRTEADITCVSDTLKMLKLLTSDGKVLVRHIDRVTPIDDDAKKTISELRSNREFDSRN